MNTRSRVPVYKQGHVGTVHTRPCAHYAHTALSILCTHGPVHTMYTRPCAHMHPQPCAHYTNTTLCTLRTHGPVHTTHTRPCAHYAHTALYMNTCVSLAVHTDPLCFPTNNSQSTAQRTAVGGNKQPCSVLLVLTSDAGNMTW